MHIKVAQFEGPLDLLLQLIEQEELDVTQVALAEVCEAYCAHLAAVEQRSPEEVAEFLMVAAKLLYLKSLALLPDATGMDDGDATGLALQLRIYRAFVEAATALAARFSITPKMFGGTRTPIVAPQFIPPPRVTGDTLRDALTAVAAELEPIVRIPKATIGRVISIEDRVSEIRHLIASRPHASFSDILRGRGGKDERIVAFLAILELVKQQVLTASQEQRFASIGIVRVAVEMVGAV